MIDREWKKDYSGNIIRLWIRKFITSLFYYRGYRKLYPESPWYTPKAIRFLQKKITKINRVFEYGCGNSSLWFAERVEEYTAVEHDQTWFTNVTSRLKEKKLTNASILFVPSDESNSEYDWKKEWRYFTILKHPPIKPEFRQYMSTIDQYPDNHFDCIIVDGRERIGCLVHSLPKLAEDGLIIFDDSSSDKYQEAFSLLSHWYYKSYRFGLGQTTFFARKRDILNVS
jgi:hypothetical protein